MEDKFGNLKRILHVIENRLSVLIREHEGDSQRKLRSLNLQVKLAQIELDDTRLDKIEKELREPLSVA